MRKPYVVVYREPGDGERMERYATPEECNARLNELWGAPSGRGGPAQHQEARAVLYHKLRETR